MKRSRALGALAVFCSLTAMPVEAQQLFQQPTLFGQPKMFSAPQPRVRTPGAPTVPGPVADQCRILTGTCPTGRLERVGTTCFCNTGKGTRRQGTTEIRPQGTFKNGP